MIITVRDPYVSSDYEFKFEIQAVLKNEKETFIIGHSKSIPAHFALGLRYVEGEFYLYEIKRETQEYYREIISADIGQKFVLRSSIRDSYNWEGQKFIKTDDVKNLGRLLDNERNELLKKTGGGYLQLGGYQAINIMGFTQKCPHWIKIEEHE